MTAFGKLQSSFKFRIGFCIYKTAKKRRFFFCIYTLNFIVTLTVILSGEAKSLETQLTKLVKRKGSHEADCDFGKSYNIQRNERNLVSFKSERPKRSYGETFS